MAARIESVRRSFSIHPKCWLQTHRQLGNGPHFKAYRASPVFSSFFTPVVVALDVPAFQIDVRRLIRRRQSRFPRQNQRVQTDRTLRLARVQFVHHLLQMPHRLRVKFKLLIEKFKTNSQTNRSFG